MQIHTLTTKPIQEALAAIDALNLECIRTRMTDGELGTGWTDEHANRVETLYRRFLQLVVKYPEEAEALVISKDVDEFWHAHLLHTRKYAEDCEAVFGFFLHHTPHRRTGAEAEASERAAAAEKTRRIYEREFGSLAQRSLPEAPAYCGAAVTPHPAYCGAAARPEAAYCGAAAPRMDAAYCGVAAEDAAAYCGATVHAAAKAYCGATIARNEPAYCGAAAEADAYCGVARPTDRNG